MVARAQAKDPSDFSYELPDSRLNAKEQWRHTGKM